MSPIALSSGDGYVAAAYIAFLFLVLSYLAIMAVKLSRIERQVVELSDIVNGRERAAEPAREKEPA